MIKKNSILHVAIAIVFFFQSTSSFAETSRGYGGGDEFSEFQRGIDEGQTQAANQKVIDANSCSNTLKNWVEEDFKDKKAMLVVNLPSYAKSCMGTMSKYQSDIQKSGPKTALADSEKLNDYLAKKFPQVAPSAKAAMARCNSMPDGQDRIAKTRYYTAMGKLESYSTSVVDEIAFIDSILPSGGSLSQIECNKNFPFPKMAERCDAYKARMKEKCDVSPEQRLERMARQSLVLLQQIKRLTDAQTECLRAGKGKEGCAPIGAMIDKINAENPWLGSKEFNVLRSRLNTKQRWGGTAENVEAVMKEMLSQSKSSLTNYLTNTREALTKSHKSNMEHARCLTSNETNSSGCDFKKTKELIKLIPDIPDTSDRKLASNREFDSHIEAEKCVANAAQDQEDTAGKMNMAGELAVTGGLMIATAGLSGIASGGLKVVRGMSALNRTRSAAIAGTTLATAANLAPGVANAIKSCTTERDALVKFSSQPEALKANVCMDIGSKFEQLKEAESSCMVDALLATADVLPFVKGLKNSFQQMKGFTREELLSLYKDPKQREAVEKILAKNGQLSDKERLEAAEAVLGKKLDANQQSCILKAHNIASGKKMLTSSTAGWPADEVLSFGDLRSKKAALDACGFEAVDVGLLMRSGVTGESAAKLPPGADDFFRKRMQAAFGTDPSLEQVDTLVRANKYISHNPDKAAEILRSGGFSEEQIKKIVREKQLEGTDIAAKANAVNLTARPDPNAVAAKPTQAVTSQGTAPKTDTPSAKLKDAMETRGPEEVKAAFAASKKEVDQIIQKTNGQNMSVDQLSDLATRGLSPADAAKYAANNSKSLDDMSAAIATLDKKISANAGKGIQGDYSAAQMQEMKYELMERYYAQKYNVKPGYSVSDVVWDKNEAEGELLSEASRKLEELRKKRNTRWPAGG